MQGQHTAIFICQMCIRLCHKLRIYIYCYVNKYYEPIQMHTEESSRFGKGLKRILTPRQNTANHNRIND